jgi:hypothetical protein
VATLPLTDQIQIDQANFAGGIEVHHMALIRAVVIAHRSHSHLGLRHHRSPDSFSQLQARPSAPTLFFCIMKHKIAILSHSTSAFACPKTAEPAGTTSFPAFPPLNQTISISARAP